MSDIKWTNDKVRLGDLQPWEHNPRQSSEKQAERIADSHRLFGQVETIAIGPDAEVYNGHQRLSSWLAEYGPDHKTDVRRCNRQLDMEERQALTAMLHAGAVGSWDWDALSGWDSEILQGFGFDEALLKDWQRDTFALSDWLASENGGPVEKEPPPIDKAAELQEKWQVKPGDLWQLGEHRLICGDCTDRATVERVMGGERADCTVTDPPFNVRDDEWDKFDDFLSFTRQWLILAKKYSGTIAAFFADKSLPLLAKAAEMETIPFRRSLIRVKPPGSQFAGGQKDGFWYDFELIQVYGDLSIELNGSPRFSVFDYRTVTGQEHGAEKPPSLYSDIWRNYSKKNGIVFEPFSGTGSNLIACEQLSRRCRAVEIEPKYCAVTLERWQQLTNKEPLLIQ